MSLKYSTTTADYLEWNTMLNLIRKLFKDGNYRMSLLIGCGCFFGLRISDILSLSWDMLLDSDSFTLIEKKTGKNRIIKINSGFQNHIKDCFKALNIQNKLEKCFLSNKKSIYTVQRINVMFKETKSKYNLKIEHFSTHSLRKTFGRKVVEQAGENSEMALIKLSELFNHSSPMITRRYLGLRHEELMNVYDELIF
jgi:integrase